MTTMGAVVVTDIVKGTCVPWGVYNSYLAQKAITPSLVTFSYLLPMTLTVFCYCRIVYKLRHKVTSLQ